MKIKIHFTMNMIINSLMIVLLCTFVILTQYSWGKYVMLCCVGLIFCMKTVQNGGRFEIVWSAFHNMISCFVMYTAISAVWAVQPSDSITMSKTLLEILIMMCILYNCYSDEKESISDLLGCVKWSSYIISIYSILFYGFDNLIKMAAAGVRLDNEYANVNTIGMLAAVGILIQFDEIVREKKWKWPTLLCIPSCCMIALSQSRKAFLIMLLGIFLLFLLHNLGSKNILTTIGRIMAVFVVTIIGFNFLLSIPIFSGVMERMNHLIANYTGDGKVDSSTLIRNRMIEIGWEQFKETPLLGMGMANPHLLNSAYIGKDAYLHNNFIELLAGGGIIAFMIYYSMYAYLFTMFWKLRNYKDKEYVICLVMMVVLLMLDYGMVSYYQKIRYIYLMLLFLKARTLKKRAKQNRLKAVTPSCVL